MKFLIACFLCLAWTALPAQEAAVSPKPVLGLELDFLPYATGGYFGAVWLGQGHWRGRALFAKATKPDLVLPKGFTGNTIFGYAALADYFPRNNFNGWWLSAGAVYWRGQIETKEGTDTTRYKNYLLSGGAGYNWKFAGNFYLSPWGAVHLRVGGDSRVPVDGKVFRPALFNPEMSLKIGWHF